MAAVGEWPKGVIQSSGDHAIVVAVLCCEGFCEAANNLRALGTSTLVNL